MSPALIPELYCTDFKSTRDFYTNVLEFEILYQREEEGFAMLSRQGAQIMIDQIGIGRDWITAELQRPFGRGVNFQIETTNSQEFYSRLKSRGVSFYLDIEDKWYRINNVYGGNRQFIVQDPDGFCFRFFENLGMKDSL
jgi:catechol 2,3-dioxygenase-like lactoylglutathione lyase family enzyme